MICALQAGKDDANRSAPLTHTNVNREPLNCKLSIGCWMRQVANADFFRALLLTSTRRLGHQQDGDGELAQQANAMAGAWRRKQTSFVAVLSLLTKALIFFPVIFPENPTAGGKGSV
ncbi:uncharacterized protein THITE_127537 [Thermothielavioides terrestris NRRL 8126]|uniref:Uncharacterized protein n=1 Tax=Thermothielavioides terrestris (strain ATCC 38088 / NRRL 8126) TaxID=578455 RepID=G2QVV0_THETT|nr:uncharacterized protein THITE_127537 [Thermothielavioides terrestris NRRL 8126]AEO63881.1 hypothetical protein THITE_127537 [Thermothielavioides terrestris NRRL 8126]